MGFFGAGGKMFYLQEAQKYKWNFYIYGQMEVTVFRVVYNGVGETKQSRSLLPLFVSKK